MGRRHHHPPIPLDELLPLLAAQLCGTQQPLQSAAAELVAHIVSTGAAEVLPHALDVLTTALLQLAGPEGAPACGPTASRSTN